MRIILFIALLPTFLAVSCRPGTVYEKHRNTSGLVWNRFDVKTFEVDIQDISRAYDFYIAIRHHTDIPYSNLDVYFTLFTASGEVRTNKYQIPVKDKEGKLLGDGLGNLWDLHYLIFEGYTFNEPGINTFEISSAMPQADLGGILQVGLIVTKSKI
jgi:gliding motility-associated lipoprotein GldH